MKAFALFLMVAAGQVVGLTPAEAQAICADSNAFTDDALNYIIVLATATDSSNVAARQAQGIPAAALAEIRFVRDSGICALAGAAYAQAERDTVLSGGRAPQPGDSTLGGVVQVFQVADRFVVADQSNRAGEYVIGLVFDQTFVAPLKRIAL